MNREEAEAYIHSLSPSERVEFMINALTKSDSVSERIEYDTDGNPYILSITSGKKFKQEEKLIPFSDIVIKPESVAKVVLIEVLQELREEIKQSIENGVVIIYKGNDKLFDLIDCRISEIQGKNYYGNFKGSQDDDSGWDGE